MGYLDHVQDCPKRHPQTEEFRCECPKPEPKGTEYQGFMEFQEAWLNGFNAAKDGHPNDATVLTTIRTAWETRDERRREAWMELTGGHGL